jgi:prepilin-type processing-associated H-X9-DG protein
MTEASEFIEANVDEYMDDILKHGFAQCTGYYFEPSLTVFNVGLYCNGEDMGYTEEVLGMSFDGDAVDKLGMLNALPADVRNAYGSVEDYGGDWDKGWVWYDESANASAVGSKAVLDYLNHVDTIYWDKATVKISDPEDTEVLAEYQFPDPDKYTILDNYPELEDDPEAYDAEYDEEMNEIDEDRAHANFTLEFKWCAGGTVNFSFADGSSVRVPFDDMDEMDEE